MNIFGKVRRWHRRQTVGIVEVTADMIQVHRVRKSASMRWNDVLKIEAGRQPTVGVEIFYVRFFDQTHEPLIVDDRMNSFESLEIEVFRRFPEIKNHWNQVYCGPPDKSELVMLWLRDSKIY